ncbi:hypothetical protein GCM10022381_11560 [Leifsonia kafniensis]|uniref:Uncharacterized protein n=1 Tax=Leifsonia kafniensis TaxID=475957 RepID=A0ABP7KAW4_9MICO
MPRNPEPAREVVSGAAGHNPQGQHSAGDDVRSQAHHAVTSDDDQNVEAPRDAFFDAPAKKLDVRLFERVHLVSGGTKFLDNARSDIPPMSE